jgi:hypothetical protein
MGFQQKFDVISIMVSKITYGMVYVIGGYALGMQWVCNGIFVNFCYSRYVYIITLVSIMPPLMMMMMMFDFM